MYVCIGLIRVKSTSLKQFQIQHAKQATTSCTTVRKMSFPQYLCKRPRSQETVSVEGLHMRKVLNGD